MSSSHTCDLQVGHHWQWGVERRGYDETCCSVRNTARWELDCSTRSQASVSHSLSDQLRYKYVRNTARWELDCSTRSQASVTLSLWPAQVQICQEYCKVKARLQHEEPSEFHSLSLTSSDTNMSGVLRGEARLQHEESSECHSLYLWPAQVQICQEYCKVKARLQHEEPSECHSLSLTSSGTNMSGILQGES
jgi:hypothetical protein